MVYWLRTEGYLFFDDNISVFVIATFMGNMDCEVAIQKTSPDLKWAQI